MRRLALLGCCFALVLVSASSAQAAQRYASPTGSGTECTQPKPCSFNEAVGKAGAGDEVIVLGGTYSLSATATLPFAATGAQVHGDPSGPIPKIKGAFLGYLLVDVAPKSRVSFLEFENTSSEFAFGSLCAGVESIFERIRAVSIGKYATGIALENCLVRDSLAFASGQLSVGLTGTTNVPGTAVGTAVNVTAIASGPESVAVRSTTGPFPGSSYTLTVKNSIALGTTDVEAMPAFGNSTLLTIAASNYRSHKETPPSHVIDVGGNQSALPIFVDSASGDFREAAGSPTIDAGFADPQAGTLDLAGNARTQGWARSTSAPMRWSSPGAAGARRSAAVARRRSGEVQGGERRRSDLQRRPQEEGPDRRHRHLRPLRRAARSASRSNARRSVGKPGGNA